MIYRNHTKKENEPMFKMKKVFVHSFQNIFHLDLIYFKNLL